MTSKERVIEELENLFGEAYEIGHSHARGKPETINIGWHKPFDKAKKLVFQALSAQKREINKKWKKKRITIPKGSTHPIHDKCEYCFELAKQEIKEMVENHYWDSLEKDRGLIIKHFQDIIKKI